MAGELKAMNKEVHMITRSNSILSGFSQMVQKKSEQILKDQGISITFGKSKEDIKMEGISIMNL